MSLEAALQENTAAIKQLIVAITSAGHAVTQPTTETAGKASRKKTEAAAETPVVQAAAVVAQPTSATGLTNDAAGNPIGTKYFDVPAHNTVYAVKPGEVEPQVAGAQAISDTQFIAKKAEYAKNFQTPAAQASAAPAAPAQPAAATTATGEPSAAPQADTASTGNPEPSFVDVVNKCRELHGVAGNDGLAAFLSKHGAGKVPELQGKAANSVLIKSLDDSINSAKLGI